MSYTEAQQELHNDLVLMSATELRALKGDDTDMDIVIDKILGEGKAVEVKGGEIDKDDGKVEPGNFEIADDGKGEGEGEEEEEKEEEEQEAAAAPAAPAVEPAAAPAPADTFTPPPLDLSGLNDEYKQTVDTLKAEKNAAFKKMMAGEMEPDEYTAIENKYEDGKDQAREQQAAKTGWLTEVHNFRVKAAQESGVNYFDDTEKFGSFDSWVQHLANKPENADKSGAWFLAEAHKKVLVEFGIAPQAAKPVPNPAQSVADDKKVSSKTVRTPNLSGIPPTLGGLPAAASAESGDGGEFAHLDSLSGLKYEQAIARMTPEQRDRWSAM